MSQITSHNLSRDQISCQNQNYVMSFLVIIISLLLVLYTYDRDAASGYFMDQTGPSLNVNFDSPS